MDVGLPLLTLLRLEMLMDGDGSGRCDQPLTNAEGEWFNPTKPRGFVPMMQGDGSTTEPGGIMEVRCWPLI
jgi:hypothetical protein